MVEMIGTQICILFKSNTSSQGCVHSALTLINFTVPDFGNADISRGAVHSLQKWSIAIFRSTIIQLRFIVKKSLWRRTGQSTLYSDHTRHVRNKTKKHNVRQNKDFKIFLKSHQSGYMFGYYPFSLRLLCVDDSTHSVHAHFKCYRLI